MAKRHGLSLPHLEVFCASTWEGISQQDLAERLLLTKGNICVMVQKMESAGLIEPDLTRTINASTGSTCPRLAGRSSAAPARAPVAMTGRVLKGLTLAEQKTLHELLCRIDDSFDEDDN